jgi:DeoR/GlpR family transcriptional regulator of sugar metabolism
MAMVLGPLDLIDVLVTDQEPPEPLHSALKTAGIEVVIAS